MPFPPRFGRAFEIMPRGIRHALLIGSVVRLQPFGGSADGASAPTATAPITTVAKIGGPVTKLQVIELSPGTGAEALPGMFVVVHYTGWLYDPAFLDGHGRKFDSTPTAMPRLDSIWARGGSSRAGMKDSLA
jgi:hypothetical protein